MKTLLRLGAAAILAAGLAIPAANAKGMGGGHAGGGHAGGVHVGVAHMGGGGMHVQHFNGNHIGNFGHHNHHHHGRFFAYAVPLYDYDYSYGYSNGCGWLWQRYLNTGSPRWKHRYYECIE